MNETSPDEKFLPWIARNFPSHSAPKSSAKGTFVKISCPSPGHGGADSSPSCSINIKTGWVNCFGCGFKDHLEVLCQQAGLSTDGLPQRRLKAAVASLGSSVEYFFVYYDLDGQPVMGVKRIEYPEKDKDVFQYHYSKGAWLRGGPKEQPLFRLKEAIETPPETPILFVEGEKKALHGNDRGLFCICAPGGAGKADRVQAKYWAPLKGRTIYILPDEDDSGQKHAVQVAGLCQDVGARVKIVHLPGLTRKQDLADWLQLPRRAEDVLQVCEETPWLAPVSVQPTIYFEEDRNLVEHVDQANAALARWNNPPVIFRQGPAMVRLKANNEGKSEPDLVSKESLFLYAAQAAKWVKVKQQVTKAGTTEAFQEMYPDKDVVSAMHCHPEPPLPILNRIVRAPVFVGDGRLLKAAGFDNASGVLYEPDPCFKDLRVPQKPTEEQVATARTLIAETFLGDYPWQDGSSLAHTFAMLLTPFIRDMFRLVPFFFVNSTVERSGKSKLVKCISLILAGTMPNTMTYMESEDELRKQITSKLKKAPMVLLIDNIKTKIDSAVLAAMATMEVWEDRELSRSIDLRIPIRCIVVGTGNNTVFSGEICKRMVHIRLQHLVDRPDLITDFKIQDLETWAETNRRNLVQACLTLIAHWIARGRPEDPQKRMGGFEAWSRSMAGLLDCIGVPGFLKNMDSVSEAADSQTQQLEVFVGLWRSHFGSDGVTASDLQARFRTTESEHVQALLRGDSDRSQAIALGRYIKRNTGRMVKGFIIHTRLKDGISLYSLRGKSEESKERSPARAEETLEYPTQQTLDIIGNVV